MEDRATCRISSQILSNWLKHDIISEKDLIDSMNKMAEKVDDQNKNDANYVPMKNNRDSFSFKAAWCQDGPYSPPPRTFAITLQPPLSNHPIPTPAL